ncbi:MAG: hypothetical protein ABSA16_13410 [Thermoguttaceae bacterium]|jgi:hypothetical protein
MTVEERITKLEKTNHVWKLAATGLACALVAIGVYSYEQFSGGSPSEIIRTKRLEIESPIGKTLVTLRGNTGGGGIININNSQGKPVFALTEIKEGDGWMGIYNSQGKVVVILGGGEAGGGHMDIYNPLEKRVVTVQADNTNNGFVGVSDQNGEPKEALTAH